jgi:hypothetical protein
MGVLLAGGCTFAPEFPSGAILCGRSPGNRCPGQLVCEQPAGVCVAPGARAARADGGGGDGPGADGPRPAAIPSGGDCNVLDPRACGSGQTCRTFCAGNAALVARCEAVGPGKTGEICGDERRCAGGLACAPYECGSRGDVLRMCQRYCNADADCPAESKCRALRCGDSAGAYRTCSTACDPRADAPVTCPEGSVCQLDPGDDASCGCVRAAVGGDGERCDDGPLGRCKGGLICTNERGARICRPICRRDAGGCSPGRACLAVPGYERWGACIPEVGPALTPVGCDAADPGSCGPDRACRIACGGGPLDGTAACQIALGTRADGAACSYDLECRDGSTCFATSCAGTVVRYCERLCKTSADCAGGTAACLGFGCGGQASPFRICARACDPVGLTGGCPEGLVCNLARGDRTDCVCPRADAGGPGSSCQDSQDCTPGHLCASGTGGSTCRPICRLDTDTCPAGTRCSALPDQKIYGACVPGAPPSACDPSAPDACAAAGIGCTPVCDPQNPSAVGARCAPAGTKAPGQPCATTAECAAGSTCSSGACADGITRGTCVRHCRADRDCGGGSARCLPIACSGQNTPYGRCTTACDPIGPATGGCGPGLTCLLVSGEITDCVCPRPSQVGGDGAACTAASTCRPGFTCVFEGQARVCRSLCRLPGGGGCPSDRRCSPLPDQRSLGACVPPIGS